MRRLPTLLFAIVAAASGCRMCASPYDYCGPVVDDGCCGSEYPGQYHDQYQVAPTAALETSEPVYYEGVRSTPPKAAAKPAFARQPKPKTALPRQAKKPAPMRMFQS